MLWDSGGLSPHRQRMLGAPFKPSVGLSGIMALDVPPPNPVPQWSAFGSPSFVMGDQRTLVLISLLILHRLYRDSF
jgi:hypothetical protein